MIIKLDKNQPKTIKMDVNVQGIDKTKLNFLFKIKLDDITIGFIPTFVGDNKLEIHIPALSSKIVGIESGRYMSCLEINDGEKYYLKPWEGELVIEEEPQITATIDEYQELDSSTVDVNYVSESTEKKEKPKKKKIKSESKKPNKKMTKKEAVEFVQKARKKLVNEDKEVVDKFIKDTLNKYGYNYNPEKEEELKTKQKPKKNNSKNIKIESKDDIVKFLQSKGIKNERTLSTLMETIENRAGDDLESMFDVANRMVNPESNNVQFNNSNDILEYFKNQQASYMSSQNPSYDTGDSEEVDYSADHGSKSRLMEQIQKAKSDLNNQLNNNNDQ